MAVIHSHVAGIDVGSRKHYVATAQQSFDVCTFGVYSKDNAVLVNHLQQKGITTVAMESTGTYWQPLFACIQAAGIEVVLSNNYIKDPQKKTDPKDARWLQAVEFYFKPFLIQGLSAIRHNVVHSFLLSVIK